MKNLKILTYRGIVLLPVADSHYVHICSSLEKADYIRKHKSDTFIFHNGGCLVEEFLYMVIDPENDGYCLTPKHGITYSDAISLINMYL